MAVPSSGQLREYADIGVELGVAQTNVSLRGMSQTAGFSTPDAMSEFYGYSGECTTGVADVFGDGSGIALYQLDNNASDASGNYNGTAFNVTYGEGKISAAGVFNGSSSRIAIPNIINQAANHSASIWIKPTNFSANRGALSMFNGNHLLVYVTTDGGFNTQGYSGAAGSTAGTLTANAWNHIVISYNYSTLTYTLYVNGVNRGADGNFNFSGRTNSIGSHNGGGYFVNYFLGDIDQVRIFNKALSASEVTSLYSEQICSNVVGGDNFNTVLYTGNGGTQSITGVGFQPDFVWIKTRNQTINHILFDRERGVQRPLFSDLTNTESYWPTNGLMSFDTDGFTLTDTGANSYGVNGTGKTFVAWCWKAGGAGVTNTAGSISSQVSANPEAGFSVVTWTTTSAAAWNVGHGLGTAPSVIISKMRTSGNWWEVYHTSLGTGKYLALQTIGAAYIDAGAFSSVTDTTWTSYTTNTVGSYVAYCFTEVSGYSSFGSYTGNGSISGPTITTGFEPAFVMTKRTDADTSGGNWLIFDNKRDTVNPNSKILIPNLPIQELDEYGIDFNSTGFQIKATDTDINRSGYNYIYMAFAK